ncbi:MAG: hypothetical protein LH613_18080 [Chamaesiphon sp.]|nr:hypothetical protein [Chamaesiphon sp.]
MRIDLGIFSDGFRTSNDDLFAICNETGNYQFISTSAIIYIWRLPRGAATPIECPSLALKASTDNTRPSAWACLQFSWVRSVGELMNINNALVKYRAIAI